MGTLRRRSIILICFGLLACSAQGAGATKAEEANLPQDPTMRLVVRELQIKGNSLISSSEILEYMPDIYNASDQPASQAESQFLYDLRPIRKLVSNPGQPVEVSLRTIQGLTQYILSLYQKNDYSGIYVYVPEGAIKNGTELVNEILPIQILEAPVTAIRVKYYDADRNEVEKGYLRRSALEKWSPIQRDKVASQKSLDYLVNLLNLDPDRHVAAVVSRGAEPNTLAIEYDVYEVSPWHYFIQVDNSGTEDREWAPRIGLINTDLLGFDDRFTALYQVDPDSWDDNYSLFGSYDFPILGPRLRLNAYGGYSEFNIHPQSGPIDFLGGGTFYGAVLRYNLLQRNGWFFDVTGSWSHEESDITPTLFPQFFASDIEYDLWGLGANLHRRNDMSTSSFGASMVQSMRTSPQSKFWNAATSTGARTNAESDFAIYYLTANHNQYLDQNKVQQLRLAGRWIEPTERLVPAKMTSFGGMYSVRGYEEYEIVADGGILASVQYEYDLIRHSQAVEQEEIGKEIDLRKLAPLGFFDYGRTYIKDPVASEREHTSLYSLGVGVTFEIGEHFSGAVYYGYPLKETTDTDVGDGRVNASAMLRW
ncbi:MAG: ShlB/FhaC/HecB family hemolysin secretion/activation protein [Sedimentisphaerales bacterium]